MNINRIVNCGQVVPDLCLSSGEQHGREVGFLLGRDDPAGTQNTTLRHWTKHGYHSLDTGINRNVGDDKQPETKTTIMEME
ncbi:hypothetical protein TcasGA2_TC015744 [Tribolium castaneum]|uniref:Uncharacterized protein n=1 Tax=Tribolium castaneum TaxID=7070 RepID=D2A3R9_TRICA|nr:hypothetical protein TcasGA2_TC015744 [Tribolium castaneum]